MQASGDFDYGNGRGSGIYVAAGCTVTIKGNNRSDKLTALGQYDAAGIGGCYNGEDCGAINISNVTVTARGKMTNGIPPGIGSTGENKCGDITIDNATVYAYGDGNPKMTVGSPGIGAGASNSRCGAAPKVTIRNNSEVHTHRGGTYADYIGISSLDSREGGQVNAIVDETSVVYKYTGDGDTPDE